MVKYIQNKLLGRICHFVVVVFPTMVIGYIFFSTALYFLDKEDQDAIQEQSASALYVCETPENSKRVFRAYA